MNQTLVATDVYGVERGNPQTVLKKPVSALQMLQAYGGSTEPKLNTGCPVLNRFLKGGLPRQGIIEISGSSGSAKTQLCLQLSLTAQLPAEEGGLGGAVVYICTEGVFPIKRLNQIIHERQEQLKPHGDKLSSVSDNLFIECISDVDGLEKLLSQRLPILIQKRKVKLVIIDSIAALFRCEFDLSEMATRARKLYAVGAALTKLNATYRSVIICVNQVSDVISKATTNSTGKSVVVPALGLAWSNVVTTRFMLSRTNSYLQPQNPMIKNPSSCSKEASRDRDQGTVSIKRKFQVVFSPNLETKSFYFFVDASGVHGVEDSPR